jgi:hypothetical protein
VWDTVRRRALHDVREYALPGAHLREAQALANVSPQPCWDVPWRACEPAHAADVEERLVDRKSLATSGVVSSKTR